MEKYDAAIIGGGPSGLTCARRLALGGRRCIILEKENALGNKVCGDGLSSRSVKLLPDVGIDESELLAAGGHRVDAYVYIYRGKQVTRRIFPSDTESDHGIGISRAVFDPLLLSKALAAGAQIKYGYEVRSIRRAGEKGCMINEEIAADAVVLGTGVHPRFLPEKCSPKMFPVGVSSRIVGKCQLKTDAFSIWFDDDRYGRNGYAWAFPVGPQCWNIGCGISEPAYKHGIMARYREFEAWITAVYFDGFVYDRAPGGACVGSCPNMERSADDIPRMGDCAGLADWKTGEGIAFAMRSGIDTADTLLRKK